MNINPIGIVAAFATFFGVWLGHVLVRKVERETVNLWIPMSLTIAFGIGLGVFSLLTSNLILSAVGGIFAVTFLWDSLEFLRQQKRVRTGRAPANPNNLRHAKILAEYLEATTVDWLDREPRDIQYSEAEIAEFKADAR